MDREEREILILKELKEIKIQLLKNSMSPLNLTEAAKFLNITKSSLYKLTSNNKIPFYKPNGKRIYFEKGELTDWLLSNKVTTQI